MIFDINPQDGETLADWGVRVVDELAALQLLATDEVAFEKSAGGTFIRLLPKGAAYPHPFLPTLAGGGLSFRKGTLQAGEVVTPTIKGKPILSPEEQTKSGEPAPVLDLDPAQIDPATLTSWAVLEVATGADGMLSVDEHGDLGEGQRCEIVHSSTPAARLADRPETGRQPLAQILWMDGVPAYVIPCVHHNLHYARTFPPVGGGLPRHFFWAV